MCQGYEAERALDSAIEFGQRKADCRRDGHTFTGSGRFPYLSWTTCSVCWVTREVLGLPRLEWRKGDVYEEVPGEAVGDRLAVVVEEQEDLRLEEIELRKKLDCSTCRGWGAPDGCPECGTKGVGAPPKS